MKVFMVEYTLDSGATTRIIPVNAEEKSRACLDAYLELPFGAIVIEAYEVA